MLIIGKVKDYFDHLSGIYGIDKKLVLDRRDWKIVKPQIDDEAYRVYKLFIGSDVFVHILHKGKFYHSIKDLQQLFDNKEFELLKELHYNYIESWNYFYKEDFKAKDFYDLLNCNKTNFHIKYKIPYGIIDSNNQVHNCLLKDFGISKHFEAMEIYLKVSEFFGFLIDNASTTSKQSDKNKIKAHGFDLKKSFRKKKIKK